MFRSIGAVFAAFILSLVAMSPAGAAEPRTPVMSKASVSASAASGVAANVVSSTTVTVPGAVLGDACVASHSVDVTGLHISCAITATGVATVSYLQATANGVALSSGTARVFLLRKGVR
jgi:hypothetical protein